MNLIELVNKIEHTRLCPNSVETREERVDRLLKIFLLELTTHIESGKNPPTTITEGVSRALETEYRGNQARKA